MKPGLSLALVAAVDQSEAALREYLANYPSLVADLRENPRSQQIAATVAIDVLACLSEVWEHSVEARLDVVTARLLAWQRIAS